MQPKKFSEYTPITETDGTEVIPILKAGVNATVKSEDLPISTATQTAIDASDADIAAHVADVANPHQVTKAQVGLGSVDNTSDATKPVSTAQATAIALKADQATTYTKTEVDTKDTAVADTAQTNLTAHTTNTSNPHSVTKSQVGLGSVDNTSDATKPVSTAQATAIALKADQATTYTKTEVDTKDTAVADTAQTNLTAHTTNTSNPHSVTKSQVGLGSVDNTSDINKPVSTAQAAALALKADVSALNSHTSNTLNPHSVTKAQVGLGNVDNTSDVNKPISTATQTALNAKANASGTVNLTGDQTIAGVKTFTSAPIAPSGTSIGGVLYLTGTGFPNGVVSAPVGSKYIDTANTNGAIEWMKASGTGNTGWVVSVGDTGWRDITSLFGTQLSTANPNDYGVLVLRKGNVISLNFKAAIGAGYTGTFVTLPLGFKSGTTASLGFDILNLWQTAGSNTGQVQIAGTFGFVAFTSTAAGTRYYGSLHTLARSAADNVWPAILPGTQISAPGTA